MPSSHSILNSDLFSSCFFPSDRTFVMKFQDHLLLLVSAPPVANMPLPPYPRRRPCDKGSTKQVQAENANAPRKSSDSGTDRLQDIQEEPRRCIGPSGVKELAKFFTPTSDEENSRVNNRTRRKKLLDPKKEKESEK